MLRPGRKEWIGLLQMLQQFLRDLTGSGGDNALRFIRPLWKLREQERSHVGKDAGVQGLKLERIFGVVALIQLSKLFQEGLGNGMVAQTIEP